MKFRLFIGMKEYDFVLAIYYLIRCEFAVITANSFESHISWFNVFFAIVYIISKRCC